MFSSWNWLRLSRISSDSEGIILHSSKQCRRVDTELLLCSQPNLAGRKLSLERKGQRCRLCQQRELVKPNLPWHDNTLPCHSTGRAGITSPSRDHRLRPPLLSVQSRSAQRWKVLHVPNVSRSQLEKRNVSHK